MMPISWLTLRNQKVNFAHILRRNTHPPSPLLFHSLRQPHLYHPRPHIQTYSLLKKALLAASSTSAPLPMNSRSFGIFLQKTSKLVIPLNGGLEDVRDFPISTASLVISFPFQVNFHLLFLSLAIDIFFQTGSAVAVERIFSGGRDTISLRRASLKPQTIRILMIVKRKLVLAREKIKKSLNPI